MSDPIILTIPVTLSVAPVESGGNAGKGKYFFAFDPHPIVVRDPDTYISFTLSPETPPHLQVRHLVTSDALGQLAKPIIDRQQRSVAVLNRNSVPYLIQAAIVVHDPHANLSFICDPQVVNAPQTGGNI